MIQKFLWTCHNTSCKRQAHWAPIRWKAVRCVLCRPRLPHTCSRVSIRRRLPYGVLCIVYNFQNSGRSNWTKHLEMLLSGRPWAPPPVPGTRCSHHTPSPPYSAVFAATSSAGVALPSRLPSPSVHTGLSAASSLDHGSPTSLWQQCTPVRDITLTQTRLLVMAHRLWHEGHQAEWSPSSKKPFHDLGERYLINEEQMFLLWRFRNFEDLKVGDMRRPVNSWQETLLTQG